MLIQPEGSRRFWSLQWPQRRQPSARSSPGLVGSGDTHCALLTPMGCQCWAGKVLLAKIPFPHPMHTTSRAIGVKTSSQASRDRAELHPPCSPHRPAVGNAKTACEQPGLHLCSGNHCQKPWLSSLLKVTQRLKCWEEDVGSSSLSIPDSRRSLSTLRPLSAAGDGSPVN